LAAVLVLADGDGEAKWGGFSKYANARGKKKRYGRSFSLFRIILDVKRYDDNLFAEVIFLARAVRCLQPTPHMVTGVTRCDEGHVQL
jgi:hypothetical protein